MPPELRPKDFGAAVTADVDAAEGLGEVIDAATMVLSELDGLGEGAVVARVDPAVEDPLLVEARIDYPACE